MKLIQQNEIYYPELMSEHAKDIIKRTLAKDERNRITIDELNDHPFLRAHRTVSSLESHKSQMSDFSASQYKQNLYPTPQVQRGKLFILLDILFNFAVISNKRLFNLFSHFYQSDFFIQVKSGRSKIFLRSL